MSITEMLRTHRSGTADEAAARDKALLEQYRGLLAMDHPSDQNIADLADAMARLRIDEGDAENDKAALDESIAHHASVANAAKRWPEIEKELGAVQVGQLRLRDPGERAVAGERQRALEQEQVDIHASVQAAIADVEKLRQEHPRVAPSIQPIPADAIPTSVLKSSPMLAALLAAAVSTWGDAKQQSQYLRFRGIRMQNNGQFKGVWIDPVQGPLPLSNAFKNQVLRDLAASKELLGLLATESNYH